MQKWQKWTLAGVVVAGLAIGGTMQEGPRSQKTSDFNTRVYIKIVQQKYPQMSGAEAVNLGGTACDILDAGGSDMDAMREVAALDGRTERARYITEAAKQTLC